ncbi:Protein dispatched [Dirofilaria immitis]
MHEIAYPIIFYYDTFVFNPSIGFETRTTFLSNQRLALESLIDIAAGKDHIKSLHKREITHNDLQYEDNRFANRKDIRKNETQLEMPINACQQYFVLGTMISYKITLLLSKLIFKVSSFNDLFSMHTMQRLCAIDSIIDSEINLNDLNATDIKRLPFSFNLPYYTMCLNMDMLSNLNSCSSLNSDSINLFKSLVLSCQSDNMSIQCQLPIATQLSNMIFQKSNGMVDTIKPFYFAVVLPIIQSNDGYTNLQFYSNLLQKLQEDYKDDDKLKLMGAQFGVKEGLFVDKLRGDVQLGVFAIILVVLIILLYTGSIFYTFCITVSLILSIGVAFFVYTIIFGIKFFPFLNLLAMILVVAVGADDAFLFMHQYRKHKEDASKKWSPVLLNCDLNNAKEENSDKEELMEYHRRQVISGLSDALSHAAISMWVTSATTAVAFFANLASNIIVLRCFGIYAGTLMMINYVLVMIILPAAIVVSDARAKSFNISNFFISRLKSRINQFWQSAADSFDVIFSRLIPQIVYIIRIPLILLTLIAFTASMYAIIKTPGIRLPEKNSIQFLRSNHPYEWFDENAASLFDFSINQHPKMNIIAIWGIKPTTSGSSLIPNDKGSLNMDVGFADVLANHLLEFQAFLKNVSRESNSHAKGNLWLDEFIEWTNLNTTSRGCQLFGEKKSEISTPKLFSGNMLTRCFLQYGHATSLPIFDQWNQEDSDGPLFDKNGNFLAYYLITYSRYDFSMVFKEMKPFFDYISNVRNTVEQSAISEFNHPLILSNSQLTKLYDLLERILNGTAISVFISLIVSMIVIVVITFDVMLSLLAMICISSVVIITIAIVFWAGWTVNVVEATIIVLTIGMSFDYCLHFAVGFRLNKTSDYSVIASAVGIPVLLAAISSFCSGFVLIGASTQAFYEISVFLMLITIISFTVAVFIFPSAVTLLLQYFPSSNRSIIARF